MPTALGWRCVLLLGLAVVAATARARTPVEVFARLPEVSGMTISPDGRYLAFMSRANGVKAVKVLERESSRGWLVLTTTENRFNVSWCRWANDSRLLCGYSGTASEGGSFFPITRLIAVNADGSKMKVLVQNTMAGVSQFQDEILDWTPEEPDTVLIEVDDDQDTFPSVFELNVYTGSMRVRARQHEPVREFQTDTHGEVRLGCGFRGTKISCYTRKSGKASWQQLLKYEAFQEAEGVSNAVGFGSDPNKLYATGNFENREALWEVDLLDERPPRLVFSHPAVDVGSALLRDDGALRGVFYETDRPFIYYTDPHSDAVMRAVKKALPDTFNVIVDETRDQKVMVLRAGSDVNPGTYYVLKLDSMQLQQIGTGDPDLPAEKLGRMQSISYPARDGTIIPGYLTAPRNFRAENLPLIVMPHGGPIARDSWDYDFLLQFLVDRGYAVLQMNFRGSDGYGSEWYHAAHQDWGGLTYSDILDGAQWAIRKGIADPRRICIVGWSFGGYAALLGATRNSDVFRCAASIAGVSDLSSLLWQQRNFTNRAIARRQIGSDMAKLKEDSPARHAADVRVPVLMIHGTRDWQVPVGHSRDMATALKREKKPHELVLIDDADHSLSWEADRITLLTALDRFLEQNLGPGVTPP